MSTPHRDDTAADRFRGSHGRQWRRVLQDQARDTRDALNRRPPQAPGPDWDRVRGGEVRIHPDNDPNRMEYMFVDEVLLTRSADAEAVEAYLRRRLQPESAPAVSITRADSDPFEGVATFYLAGPGIVIDDLCTELDTVIRPGAAMPEHIVHVTVSGCCPYDEPVPSDGPIDPPPAEDDQAGSDVKVVVIDTGRREDVEQQHALLSSPQITGTAEMAQIGHYTGHGTFVCGIVRAGAPDADIDVNGLLISLGAVVESSLSKALWEAIRSDEPDIISMSAGTTSRGGFPPIALAVAVEALQALDEDDNLENDVLLVAAAGNDGVSDPFYPAYFSAPDPRIGRPANPRVVSVGALDADESLAVYSNRGWPTVYARGSKVVGVYPDGPYTYQTGDQKGTTVDFATGLATWSGTSFSTPVVSGLIAAHTSRCGEDVLTAWEHLCVHAQTQAVAGIGPILRPGDASIQP